MINLLKPQTVAGRSNQERSTTVSTVKIYTDICRGCLEEYLELGGKK
jgi:hypothetical protein